MIVTDIGYPNNGKNIAKVFNGGNCVSFFTLPVGAALLPASFLHSLSNPAGSPRLLFTLPVEPCGFSSPLVYTPCRSCAPPRLFFTSRLFLSPSGFGPPAGRANGPGAASVSISLSAYASLRLADLRRGTPWPRG